MSSRTLEEHLAHTFVGREAELATLVDSLEASDSSVTFVHGLAGVGTSALLEGVAAEARSRGISVVHLDCRLVQPTPTAVIAAICGQSDSGSATCADLIDQLGRATRTVVLLDHWDAFRLLDAWFRLEVVPRLPPNVSLVAAGQHPPTSGWRASSDPSAAVRSLHLGPLSREDSLRLVAQEGVVGPAAEQLYRLTRGLPLALRVAAGATRGSLTPDLAAVALPEVAAVIAELYLDPLEPELRAAVEALSVVRRGTLSLLTVMMPGAEAALLGRLAKLPFVQVSTDGLALHEAVGVPIALAMRGVDPSRYAAYRQAAWRVIDRELAAARPFDVWRYTADLLYLIDHPLVREAFFPSAAPMHAVEPATRDDLDDVVGIAVAHLSRGRAATVAAAARTFPSQLRVARSTDERVAGFLLALERRTLSSEPLEGDPIVAAVRGHLRRRPLPPHQDVLILLATLARASGEAPSEATAALWLDIKRTYLDRRDRLRRVYAVVADLEGFLAAARTLGFEGVGDPVTVDGEEYHVAVLDLGSGCVDGWLSRLAQGQVGGQRPPLTLDRELRTVTTEDGKVVQLSRLEFGLLQHLMDLDGSPASRAALVRAVWGHSYTGGSNVVDAVVRTLRRKLGVAAGAVATVRGVGYRFDGTAASSRR
jgi:DNA-binding response OmpR family regulator